ncbi:MAG: hypothetical protein C0594_10125, partial [Marinilabiliales bacterium]
DENRRNRDLCFIGAIAIYMLNIVDATVDAHLYDWDVSDDLSIRLEPRLLQSQDVALSLNVKINLK